MLSLNQEKKSGCCLGASSSHRNEIDRVMTAFLLFETAVLSVSVRFRRRAPQP